MKDAVGLVIFDCDGVLVDSEPLALRMLIQSLAEAGLSMPPKEVQARFLGRSLATICATLKAEFDVDLTEGGLGVMRERLYELFRRELKPIVGVVEALDAIEVPYCVASSSQPERIRLSLALTGLLERFEPHIFSAAMVRRGKPAPDLFLHAAEEMGVAPSRCLVIEDSPAGVEAAKRAGMHVFGFTGGGHARLPLHAQRLAQAGAELIFDDMASLPSRLGSAA